MKIWLYDPNDDNKGKIIEGEAEIKAARIAGWKDAPYPSHFEEKIEEIRTTPPKIVKKTSRKRQSGKKDKK